MKHFDEIQSKYNKQQQVVDFKESYFDKFCVHYVFYLTDRGATSRRVA